MPCYAHLAISQQQFPKNNKAASVEVYPVLAIS